MSCPTLFSADKFHHYHKLHFHLSHEVRIVPHKLSSRYSVISAVLGTSGKLWIFSFKVTAPWQMHLPQILYFTLPEALSVTRAHIPMSMCTHINTQHTCHMHNHTQSLRAMLHSSNRPVNLSQGVPVCDSVTVSVSVSVHACVWAALAMSPSEGGSRLETEESEQRERKGLTDQDRGIKREKLER